MYLLGPGNGCFFLTDLFAAARKKTNLLLLVKVIILMSCKNFIDFVHKFCLILVYLFILIAFDNGALYFEIE